METLTFGTEFITTKIAIEMTEGLRYKLRMLGVPLEDTADGSQATTIYCNNEAVHRNCIIPESTLKKKNHSCAFHRCRQAVAAGIV